MNTPFEWHMGSHPVNPRWPLMPALLPDELLSSWLIRAAMKFGCNAKTLTGQIWPKWRVWSSDLDRGVRHERLSDLVTISGIPEKRLQRASLRWVAESVQKIPCRDTQIWPWVLTLGSRGVTRKGGLQYCPFCMKEGETPFYRLPWRLAWHIGCESHDCALSDRCWDCCAPLEPYRLSPEDRNIAKCGRCKADLRYASPAPVMRDALAFQRLADQILRSGHGVAFDEVVGAQDWFETAHFITTLFRNAYRSMGHNALSELMIKVSGKNPQHSLILPGTGLEGMSNVDRQWVLTVLYRFMTIARDEFVRALHKTGVRRQTLCPKRPATPRLLSYFAYQLPETPRRGKTTKSLRAPDSRPRHEVMLMMNRLMRRLAREKR